MKPTRQMKALEENHGKPIAVLIVEALNREGTIEGAARSLGVNPKTFYGWMVRFQIRTRKIAIPA